MLSVIKLVNVHYRGEKGNEKVQFQTLFDTTTNIKTFNVITDGELKEVKQEEGNEVFRRLKQEHDTKVITIIDVNNESITYFRIMEHFEVRIGNDFYCTCDNIEEVRDVVKELKEKLE